MLYYVWCPVHKLFLGFCAWLTIPFRYLSQYQWCRHNQWSFFQHIMEDLQMILLTQMISNNDPVSPNHPSYTILHPHVTAGGLDPTWWQFQEKKHEWDGNLQTARLVNGRNRTIHFWGLMIWANHSESPIPSGILCKILTKPFQFSKKNRQHLRDDWWYLQKARIDWTIHLPIFLGFIIIRIDMVKTPATTYY